MQGPIVPADASFYIGLLDHIGDGVYFVDRERRILYWNEGAYRLTGYKAEEVLGRCCQDGILCQVDHSGKSLCQDLCPLNATMSDGKFYAAKAFLRHKTGKRVPVSLRVQPLRGADGSIIGAIEIFSDDTPQVEAQRRTDAMIRLAFLDHLTQLPNRRFMEMSLQTALTEYQVHNETLGVLVVDLDEFKAINDTFGHSDGDRALQQAAKTLAGALRPTDTIGRWGGDEFLAIARNVDREVLGKVAERCVALIAQTSISGYDKRSISLSSSIGAALVRPGETVAELIHRADKLMYRSKTDGRGRATTE